MQLRAVQSHALHPTVAGGGDVGEQPRIGLQLQAMAIRGLGRQIAQLLQVAGQLGLFGDQLQIFLPQGRTGLDTDPHRIAVHHHFAAIQATRRQVANAEHRRDAQSTRQQGDMGGIGAAHRYQPFQFSGRHIQQLRNADLLPHQDGVVRVLAIGHLPFPQAVQQPLAQIEDVGSPFPQIGIVHLGEDVGVFEHGRAQGARRPIAGRTACPMNGRM